jgi:site-specific DNA recombinase
LSLNISVPLGIEVLIKIERKITMNIGYIRISHTDSLDGTSLEVQEKRIKAYAELSGFKIDKVYSEICSGSVNFSKRPVFTKVLNDLKKGSILVVSRLDRLSRSILDTLELVRDFTNENKQLAITDIGNCHTDGVSKVFITILSAVAEVEVNNISNRIKASKEIAKKEHKFLGGFAEFGYTRNSDGSYSVNEKEREIFSSIINLRNNKLSLPKISEIIRNKFGRKLHPSYVCKLLKRDHNFKLLSNGVVA